jgi:hypothetical protein
MVSGREAAVASWTGEVAQLLRSESDALMLWTSREVKVGADLGKGMEMERDVERAAVIVRALPLTFHAIGTTLWKRAVTALVALVKMVSVSRQTQQLHLLLCYAR